VQVLVTVGAVCLLLGGGVGWWVGDGLETGRCAQREHDVAVQYAENANARLEAARRDLEAQNRRAAARAQREAESDARRVREAADYEVLIARTARPECSRDPDAFERLRDAIRAANLRTAGAPTGVRPDVLPDPGADRAE